MDWYPDTAYSANLFRSYLLFFVYFLYLFYFCAVIEWWGAGTGICLGRGADLHMAQLMPLPPTVSCFSKIQIGLHFWYRLTRAVPDKGLLNGCFFCFVACSSLS